MNADQVGADDSTNYPTEALEPRRTLFFEYVLGAAITIILTIPICVWAVFVYFDHWRDDGRDNTAFENLIDPVFLVVGAGPLVVSQFIAGVLLYLLCSFRKRNPGGAILYVVVVLLTGLGVGLLLGLEVAVPAPYTP